MAREAPVVLLPGLVAGCWIWNMALEPLRRAGHPCLAVREAIAATHDSIDDAVSYVSEQIDRVGFERVTLLGASLGSAVALTYAARHPHRVRSIVISGAPAMKGRVDLGITSFGKFTRPIAFDVARRLFFDRSCIGDDVVESTFRQFLHRRRLANMVRLLREAGELDVKSILENIDADTLMVWGEHDEVSRCDDWERLVPLVKRGAFVRISRCGHLPMIERSDEFNRVLLDFLAHGPSADAEDA